MSWQAVTVPANQHAGNSVETARVPRGVWVPRGYRAGLSRNFFVEFDRILMARDVKKSFDLLKPRKRHVFCDGVDWLRGICIPIQWYLWESINALVDADRKENQEFRNGESGPFSSTHSCLLGISVAVGIFYDLL